MKSLGIIFVNAFAYFALCVVGFLFTMLLSGGSLSEREFLSVSPLTLAAVASLPVASLHGFMIGGAIAFWQQQLSKNPFVRAAILALFANLLTIFWWLFLFLQLGEQPTASATARGAVIAIVMNAISFAANFITIQFVRKTEKLGVRRAIS